MHTGKTKSFHILPLEESKVFFSLPDDYFDATSCDTFTVCACHKATKTARCLNTSERTMFAGEQCDSTEASYDEKKLAFTFISAKTCFDLLGFFFSFSYLLSKLFCLFVIAFGANI